MISEKAENNILPFQFEVLLYIFIYKAAEVLPEDRGVRASPKEVLNSFKMISTKRAIIIDVPLEFRHEVIGRVIFMNDFKRNFLYLICY